MTLLRYRYEWENPASPLIAALKGGTRSQTLKVISDSTAVGVDTRALGVADGTGDGFPAALGRKLGKAFGDWSVYYRGLNLTTYRMGGPCSGNASSGPLNWVQIQQGAGNGGGARTWTASGTGGTGGVLGYDPTIGGTLNPLPGDFEIVARVTLDNWANGSEQVITCRGGGTAARSAYMAVTGSGAFALVYSLDGATNTTASSLSGGTALTLGYAAGTTKWLKARMDLIGTNRAITLWTSDDGYTWTQFGSTLTKTDGNAPIFAPTAAAVNTYSSTALTWTFSSAGRMFTLGARDGGNVATAWQSPMKGSVSWIEWRNGIDGPSVCPPLPEQWDQLNDDQFHTFSGAPMLIISNACASGRNTGYFLDQTTATGTPGSVATVAGNTDQLLMYGENPILLYINTCHNEGANSANEFAARYRAVIAECRRRYNDFGLICGSQNPVVVGTSDTVYGTRYAKSAADKRVARHSVIGRIARSAYAGFVDIYQAFAKDAATLQLQVGIGAVGAQDGLHATKIGQVPGRSDITALNDNVSGIYVWVQKLWRQFFDGWV